MARSSTTLVPTAGLEVAPFGILSPATTTYDHSDQFWTSGFTYESNDAGVKIVNGSIYGVSPEDTVTVVDNSTDRERFKTYYPFNVQASVKVSTFGTTPEEIKASAEKALDIVTQKAIEAEFWGGGIAKLLTAENDNRYLSGEDTLDRTPTAGTGVKLRYGIGILERAIDESTGFLGTIHIPSILATPLNLVNDNGVLRTPRGTPVVVGSGYSAFETKGPNGEDAPAGHAWAYVTGPVSVRLGPTSIVPDNINQAVNTRINDVEYFVDRPVAVTWSTNNAYAVLVDLSLDYA